MLKELDKNLVSAYLSDGVVKQLSGFDVLKVTTSTSDEVLGSRFLQNNQYFVCLSNEQTAGRGRNGNVWESPSNSHIYMSVGSVFDISVINGIAGLSLACGVTVVRLLMKMGVKAGIKWPNDVLVDDKKLAGILVETRIKSSQVAVVVGLGLNVDMPASVAANIEQPWTDLNSLMLKKDYHSVADFIDKKNVNRNYVAAKLIEEIVRSMNRYVDSGFESFSDDWHQFDVLSGRDVIVKTSQDELEGRVTGFNEDHSLVVMINNEEKSYYAADVKLKLNDHVSN